MASLDFEFIFLRSFSSTLAPFATKIELREPGVFGFPANGTFEVGELLQWVVRPGGGGPASAASFAGVTSDGSIVLTAASGFQFVATNSNLAGRTVPAFAARDLFIAPPPAPPVPTGPTDPTEPELRTFPTGFFANRVDGTEGPDILGFARNASAEFIGRGGDDTITGSQLANRVEAGAGDDRVTTFGFPDIVFGGEGRDVIKTGFQEDYVDAGPGDDVILTGGRGGLASEDDDVVLGGEGRDVIKTGDGPDQIDGGAGGDVILSGEGDDILIGGEGDDTLKPGRGDDSIWGGAGNDIALGFRGSELLVGGDGEDTLKGGLEDDTLIGGAGDDRLVGGPGRDSFVYRDGYFGRDRVIDFRIGSDVVDFSEADGVDALINLSFEQVGSATIVSVVGTDSRIVLAGLDLDAVTAAAEDVFLF